MIDAVDVIVSNGADETGELANAFMVLKNLTLGNNKEERDENKKKLLASGVMEVGDDGDAHFVTKNLPYEFFSMIIKWLDEHIYGFSNSVDYNNPEIGALSGVALKNKMLGLETSAQISENEFKCATLEMFRIASMFWGLQKIGVNYLDMKIKMSRNYPLDVLSEAQATQALKGMVSEKTRLGMLSFVSDPEKEMEEMDAEGNVNLDNIPPVDTAAGTSLDGNGKEIMQKVIKNPEEAIQ
jgi:SPP1 family phage portal protein